MTDKNKLPHVEGHGGGKGGGGKQFKELPNTLRSKAVGRLVDLISEGEIGGLIDGEKSIYLDGTPLMAQDGSLNFDGVSYQENVGTPDQDYLPGFPSVEQEVQVGVQVQAGTNNAVVRRISDLNTDALRVIIGIPALNYTNEDEARMEGTSVSIAIDVKPQADAGGTWTTVVGNQISGKTTSQYQAQYRFDLPGVGPWDVRVRRLTPDAAEVKLNNDTFWTSYTLVYDHKLSYPHSALVGLSFDAEFFGNTNPKREYEIKGRLIQVPTNYDPITRQYTGIWDGTFKTAWCDNPAWVFYDLATHKRYSVGLSPTHVDKWALYKIAQYCDEMVPDGFGGQEPRFTFNGEIKARGDAYKVLQSLASTFRAMTYWSAGQVTLDQDAPKTPVKLFNQTNVLNGNFEYSTTPKESRHTVAIVKWINPELGYKPDFVVVEDRDAIAKFGYRPTEVSGMGCTSKGQAQRMGLWALLTEKVEKDMVKFTTGYEGQDLLPGQIIEVADPSYAGVRMGGRIMAITDTDTVTLDAPFNFEAGETYTATIMLADGTLHESEVSNAPGLTDQLDLLTAMPSNNLPIAGGVYILKTNSVEPRPFRVMAVSEADKHTTEVFAIAYDSGKFTAVDVDHAFDTNTDNQFTRLPRPDFTAPARSLTLNLDSRKLSYGVMPILRMDWEAPEDARNLAGYVISYRRDNDNWVNLPLTTSAHFEIENPQLGKYTVRVTALNQFGHPSIPVEAELDMKATVNPTGQDLISNLVLLEGGTQFTGQNAKVVWDARAMSTEDAGGDVTGVDEFFSHFRVTVYAAGTSTVLRQESVHTRAYEYTIEKNLADGAGRAFDIGVASISREGDASNELKVAFSNPAPSLTPTVSATAGLMSMDYDIPTDPDFIGVRVWASTTPAFIVGAATQVWDGAGQPRIPLQPGATVYYRYAAIDQFGQGLVSNEQNIIIPRLDGSLLEPNSVTADILGLLTGDIPWDAVNVPAGSIALADLAQSIQDEINRVVEIGKSVVPGGVNAGANGDLQFYPNTDWAGGTHVGEIGVGDIDGDADNNGSFTHPTLGLIDVTAHYIHTPWEGTGASVPEGQRFYVMYSATDPDTRFGWTSQGSAQFTTVTYDDATGVWTAYGNLLNDATTFTPDPTDLIVAMGTRSSTAVGGIETLTSLIGSDVPTMQRVTALEATSGDHESRITTQETVTGEHASRLTATESVANDAQSRVSTQETVTAGHASRLTATESVANDAQSRVGVQETVTAGHASRLTTTESIANDAQSRVASQESVTADHASRLTATESVADDAQSRVVSQESVTAGHASRISATEVQISGALPLLPQGGNLALDASHWYMPDSNNASGNFVGADLESWPYMIPCTVGTATAGSITGTGLQGYDGRWMFTRYAIPVDTSRRYRMRVKVLFPAGADGNFFAGLGTLDGSFNPITGGAGTHRYFVGSFPQASYAGTVQTFEGEITGEGNLATQFRPGTQYVRPMIITSYNTSATAQPIVLSIDFEDVTEEFEISGRTGILEETLWDGAETRSRIMFLADANGSAASGWLVSSGTPGGAPQTEVGFAADFFRVFNGVSNEQIFYVDTANNTLFMNGDIIASGSLSGAAVAAGSVVTVGTGGLISGTSIYDRAAMAGHDNGDYRFWAGGLSGPDANFSVDREGAIEARRLTILTEDGGAVWFDTASGFSEIARAQILAQSATRVATLAETVTDNVTASEFSLTDTTSVKAEVGVSKSGLSISQIWHVQTPEPSDVFPSSLTLTLKYRNKATGGAWTTGVTKTLSKITSGTPNANQFKVSVSTVEPFYEDEILIGGQPVSIPGSKTETVTAPDTLIADFTASLVGDADAETYEVIAELTPADGSLNFDNKTRTITLTSPGGGKPFVILDDGAVPGDGNADTLDGYSSGDFGRLASANTWTQVQTFDQMITAAKGIRVSGAGTYSSTHDTRTDVGIVLPSGAAIHGENGGHLRYLFEWNANNKIVIGQTGTGMITGVSLQGGASGGVELYHAGFLNVQTMASGLQFGDTGTRAQLTAEGTNGVILNNTTATDIKFRTQGNNRLVYDHSANWWQLTNNAGLRMSDNSARVKIGLWTNTDRYGIGMQSAMTHGHLNDYAITFVMNNETDRGFWWGHNSHANSEGAMSLTTDGRLWLHQSLTVSGAWGSTSGVTAAKFRPVDFATGKPELNIKKTSTANQWNIELWDGATNNGVINFGSSSLRHQGNEIATQSWVNSQIGGTVTASGTNTFTGSNTFNSGILIGNAGTGTDHRLVSNDDGGAGQMILAWSNSDWSNSYRLYSGGAQIYAGNSAYTITSTGMNYGDKDAFNIDRLQVGNGTSTVNANYWAYVYGRENQNENVHKYGIYSRLNIEGNVSNFTQDRTRAAIYGYALLEDNSTTADTHVASPVGVYGYALGSKGHADAMYGVYGFANNSGGADTDVNMIYGGYFEGRLDNAGSTAGTICGIRGVTRLTSDVDDSVVAIAVHGILNVDGGTMSTARMLYGTADVEAGATVTTMYGLHLDMQNNMGGTVTDRRGIWLEGNTSYLTNSIGGRSYFGNAEGFVKPDSPFVVHMENTNVLVELIQGPSDGSGAYSRYARGSAYVWDIGIDSGSDFLFRPNGATTALRLNYDMLEAAFNNSGLSFDNKQALTATDSWLRLNPNDQFTSGVYFGSSVVRTDGTFNISNVVTLDDGSGSSLRVSNASGYVDIGPQNTTWCHFTTDRSKFYFNKHLEAVTRIGVYNTQTYMENGLMRVESTGANRARLWVHGAGSSYTTADILLEDDSGATVRGLGMYMYNRASGKEWFFGQPYGSDENRAGVYYSYQTNGSEGGETATWDNYIVEFQNNGQVLFQNGSASLPSISFRSNQDCGFRLSSNEIIVGSDGNNVMGWKPGRIEVYNNSIIDFNSHTGARVMMELEGRPIMNQMSDRGALLLRSADDSLCLFAGDTHTNMTANVSVTAENMYFGADGNFQWYGNMQNGWANRYTMTFSGGNLTVSGNIVQQSDARLKHSIRDWDLDIDKIIEGVKPRRYGWNNPFKVQNDFGLIAQELRDVLPVAVVEDDEGYLSVDYGRLSVVALAAIKKDRERIEDLEDRCNRLQKRLERIEKFLALDGDV